MYLVSYLVMATRMQKVVELLADLHSLKHSLVFRSSRAQEWPRITPAQWGIVMLLQQHGTSTVKDVASSLGITSSAATQLVDGLVAGGYITRIPDTKDRRTIQLALSKNTKTQVEKMNKQILKQSLELFKVLSDREFDQYRMLNKKIVERVKATHK